MKILHSLFVAALLLGTSGFALAGPGPGEHDPRGQYSSHNDYRHGADRNRRSHVRNGRHDRQGGSRVVPQYRHAYRQGRQDPRRYHHRPVVVYRNHARPYGHGHWRRGYRYRGPSHVVYDYGHYRLRQPPRGYRWVRADNSDFLLVAIATGIILDIALR